MKAVEHPPVHGIQQLLLANKLALQIHDSQPYGKGARHIYDAHLLPTADFAVTVLGHGALTAAFMLLHDGIEDGKQPDTGRPVTKAWLLDQGVYEPLVESIDHISRRSTETYDQYIERLVASADPRAIEGKVIDNVHNLGNTILMAAKEGIAPSKRRQRTNKYVGSIAILGPRRPAPGELYEGEGPTIQSIMDAAQREQEGHMPPDAEVISLPKVFRSRVALKQAA